MTDKLPPNLLALFAPRPALRYLPYHDHAPEERRTAAITGVAQYLDKLREPDDYKPTESLLQRRDRLKLERKEKQQKLLTEGFEQCACFYHLLDELHPDLLFGRVYLWLYG
jgi:U1 small nuclear ribonucleoprotein